MLIPVPRVAEICWYCYRLGFTAFDVWQRPVNGHSWNTCVEQEKDSLSVDQSRHNRAREYTFTVIRRSVLYSWSTIYPCNQIFAPSHAPCWVASICLPWVPLITNQILFRLGHINCAARVVHPWMRCQVVGCWTKSIESHLVPFHEMKSRQIVKKARSFARIYLVISVF